MYKFWSSDHLLVSCSLSYSVVWSGRLTPSIPPQQGCWGTQVLVQPCLEPIHAYGHLHVVWQAVVTLHHPVREEVPPHLQPGRRPREQSLVSLMSPRRSCSLSGLILLESEPLGWVNSVLSIQNSPRLDHVTSLPPSLQRCHPQLPQLVLVSPSQAWYHIYHPSLHLLKYFLV